MHAWQFARALGIAERHGRRMRGQPVAKKLDGRQTARIAKSFTTGRKSGAEMARLCNISQPTVSRIVAQHRMVSP